MIVDTVLVWSCLQKEWTFAGRFLQEILSSALPTGRDSSPVIGNGAEDLKVRVQVFSQGHYACDIAAAVAVVRRGPDRDDVLRCEVVFVSFVDELMCSCDELKVVDVVELQCKSV